MCKGRRVLKLGSSCGLPLAMVPMLGATSVLVTNHWEEEGRGGRKEGNGNRLMPKNPHGANLTHKVISLGGIGSGGVPAASMRHLNWHNGERACNIAGGYRPDLIIGSDLVYYPADMTPIL
jgi:hypothetical protein